MLTRTVKLDELEEAFNRCLYRNLRYKLEDLESALFSMIIAYNTNDYKFIERAKAYLDWMMRYNLVGEVLATIEEIRQELKRIESVEDEITKKRLLGELILRTHKAFHHLAFKCMLEEL